MISRILIIFGEGCQPNFIIGVRRPSLLTRKEQEEAAVSRARRILFAKRACDHAILLAANSFIAEFPAFFFRAASASHCFQRRQSDDEIRATLVWDAFEAAAEPSEGSVVKIEPALAERSRIHPFAA
jgi:hypothetical protein